MVLLLLLLIVVVSHPTMLLQKGQSCPSQQCPPMATETLVGILQHHSTGPHEVSAEFLPDGIMFYNLCIAKHLICYADTWDYII